MFDIANNIFLIHGSYGNPYKNWFSWLKEQLAKRKICCTVPAFPAPIKQDYQSWSKILKANLDIGYIKESTTIITHSLGCIFIVKFLIENKVKVKRLITVAGFNNFSFEKDMHLYQSFYLDEEKISQISEFVSERYSLFSSNDPYIPVEKAVDFATSISAEKVLIENAGHFNRKDGYSEFREILNFIK